YRAGKYFYGLSFKVQSGGRLFWHGKFHGHSRICSVCGDRNHRNPELCQFYAYGDYLPKTGAGYYAEHRHDERTDQENAPLGKRVLYPDLRSDQRGFWKPGGLLSGKCIERCDHVFPVSVYGSALYPYDTTVYGLRTGNFPGGLSADSEKERGGTAPGK